MVVYRATNIETGEIIEGGARDLARELGVVQNTIYNAVAMQQKIKYVWFVSTEKRNCKLESKANRMTPHLIEEWERVTAPFKKLSAKKRGVQGYENKSK